MAVNTLEPMMWFITPLLPLHEMVVFTWDKNNYMRFLQPHSIPVLMNRHCVHQKWHLHTLVDIVVADPMQANLLP
jgi:hypothetical protein